MKKLLLIPALMLGSVALAADYNFEITPLIGYNVAEGNIDLDDYATFGAELQYNGLDSVIKPELSLLYSKADYNTNKLPSSADTDVWRLALNGVYEYDKFGSVVPLAKAGFGYESMNDGSYEGQTGNADSLFVDAGVGAKIPFNDMLALKLEAVYMLKYNDARYDSNLAVLAGLNIAFGPKAQKAAPVKEEPVVVAAAVVDGDDDNDGVLNSKDKCPNTAAGLRVDVKGCFLDGDDDNDGVLNASDSCLASAAGEKVDASGCKIDGDDDKDGVLNSKDICPNTVAGEVVNSDGCPAKANLNINFENNSFKVDSASEALIQKYADFLITYTAYSTKIVGYTDSRGSDTYNQKLSESRANVVKDMLIDRGVPADRLAAEGMGELNPIADNDSSEGRAQNRRIEAELTKN